MAQRPPACAVAELSLPALTGITAARGIDTVSSSPATDADKLACPCEPPPGSGGGEGGGHALAVGKVGANTTSRE